MIKLGDVTLLAITKFRTYKIRTIATILLASLLFGVLVTSSLVMTGAFKSVADFRSDGLTSRYIVNVNKSFSANVVQQTLRDPQLIAEAKKRYTKIVEEKTAEAKKLGVSYSQTIDRPPYVQASEGDEERLIINDSNGIVRDLLTEKFSADPAFDEAQLKTTSDRYKATGIFTSENYSIAQNASLNTLSDGKEIFYDQSSEAVMDANYVRPLIDGSQMVVAPQEITDPFMLPNNAGWKPESNAIPIILPQNIIEQLLGLTKLPDATDASQKLARLANVRERAATTSFVACYRNGASISRIQDTILQQNEIKAHASDKDYQKPSLLYALPDPTKCENPTVLSDTRTASEKTHDANQKIFDNKYGSNTEPVSYLVTFKVVGVSPPDGALTNPTSDQPTSQIRSLNDVVNNVLKTSGIGQVIPKKLYDQLPGTSKYADLFTYTPMYLFGNEDNKMRYVEFSNARDAETFINQQGCTIQYDNTCKPAGRPYRAELVFSNSTALDDIQAKATQWFGYALVGIMGLASVIMWIAIGRTIADSRHETAIFRAIGFKRVDIAQIYIFYTVILSVLVALFAACLGIVGAYFINQRFSPELTARAQYGFGGIDISKEMTLIGIDIHQLGLLLIACLATGILSMVVPLLFNVRRSPIQDMREE